MQSRWPNRRPRQRCPGLFSLLVLGWCGLVATRTQAQDFRIYTRVYDSRPVVKGTLAGKTKKPAPQADIGRSLSLFHAGKVYDCIESVGEMTIFEPAQQRFLIIHGQRMIYTTLPCAKIQQELTRAEREAEKFCLVPPRQPGAAHQKLIAAIQLQLQPQFREEFDPAQHRLRLSNPLMTYDLQCAEGASRAHVDAYLAYADWVARLNYLLHPQTLLPGPRLQVNGALRQRQLLPVEVQLDADIGNGLHRRAVHQFQWKFDTGDRRLIHHWESLLASKEMKQVSFDEFHRIVQGPETIAKDDTPGTTAKR